MSIRQSLVPAFAFSARTQPAPPDVVAEVEPPGVVGAAEDALDDADPDPGPAGEAGLPPVQAPSSRAPPAARTARRDAPVPFSLSVTSRP
ncbi:hypothetical protein GCM10009826_34780 [Humibacillus xanthopallidus]